MSGVRSRPGQSDLGHIQMRPWTRSPAMAPRLCPQAGIRSPHKAAEMKPSVTGEVKDVRRSMKLPMTVATVAELGIKQNMDHTAWLLSHIGSIAHSARERAAWKGNQDAEKGRRERHCHRAQRVPAQEGCFLYRSRRTCTIHLPRQKGLGKITASGAGVALRSPGNS